MKDARPIEEQVLSLSIEERTKILKVSKNALIVAIISVIVALVLFGTFYFIAKSYKDESTDAKLTYGGQTYTIRDPDYYDNMEKHDRYFAFGLIFGGLALIIPNAVVLIYIYNRCPCYSDKRCSFIKKAGGPGLPKLQNKDAMP